MTPAGFEPAPDRVEADCSCPLSYGAVAERVGVELTYRGLQPRAEPPQLPLGGRHASGGGPEGSRTPDFPLAGRALSPLSYRPMAGSREPAVWLSDEAGVTLPQAAAVPLPLSSLDLHPPCSDGKGTHGHQQIESNDPGPIR